MKFLLTGISGFLGQIVSKKIVESGHEAVDLNSLFGERVDLTEKFSFDGNDSFEVIVHIAGKAHSVPRDSAEANMFFKVNFHGTKNLCQAVKSLVVKPKTFVLISTVAVYGVETGQLVNESYPLLGSSAYAKSKIAAEEFVIKWGETNNIKVLILRLPLIAGPTPPGNLGTMINGLKSGRYLSINKGRARRSMVMASDVGQCIVDNSGAEGVFNLTDNQHPSFREIESVICTQLNRSLPLSLPNMVGRILGFTGDFLKFLPVNSGMISKMSNDLTFDSTRAQTMLNWTPSSVIKEFKIS